MIRHLQPGDGGIFRRIRLEALLQDPDAFASTHADWADLPMAEWERRLTDNPVFVGFAGDTPVAIMGMLRHTPAKMAHRGIVIMVYTSPGHRGRGWAGLVLAALSDHARDAGVAQLELSVNADNSAALTFYAHHGFSRAGVVEGGYRHDGRDIDEVLLTRRIDAPGPQT